MGDPGTGEDDHPDDEGIKQAIVGVAPEAIGPHEGLAAIHVEVAGFEEIGPNVMGVVANRDVLPGVVPVVELGEAVGDQGIEAPEDPEEKDDPEEIEEAMRLEKEGEMTMAKGQEVETLLAFLSQFRKGGAFSFLLRRFHCLEILTQPSR